MIDREPQIACRKVRRLRQDGSVGGARDCSEPSEACLVRRYDARSISRRWPSEESRTNGAIVDVSGNGSGDVFIRGKHLILSDASVLANNTGSKQSDAAVIVDVQALNLSNGGQIASNALASGASGQIFVTSGPGSLTIASGGSIINSTFAGGAAGPVTVDAGSLTITVLGPAGDFTGIASNSEPGATGPAGSVVINADKGRFRSGRADRSSPARLARATPAR